MNNTLSKSKDMSTEYCATVVRLGEVKPMENADRLGTVMVEGREIVVRKDATKEGDIMIYVSNECQLDPNFLHRNNEFSDIELNANYDEVLNELAKYDKQIAEVPYTEDDERTVAMKAALEETRKDYLQSHKGYFSKNCRVRMQKLRGVYSMGYLIRPEQMSTYCSACSTINWSELVGEDFDTVNDKLFVKAYVPETKGSQVRGKGRYEKRIKHFNRMIPGQFAFHYDTQQLQRCMNRIKPDDVVDISVKEHGTSFICGNVKVKNPRWNGLYKRLFNYLPSFLQFTKEEYDVVYSSRSVIKNANLNSGVTDGYYGTDIWGEYKELIGQYIPQGMTVYGEIVGYLTNSTSGIQSIGGKVCDYGCKPGCNSLMIYRITTQEEGGELREWEIPEVLVWTERLKTILEEKDKLNDTHEADRIRPISLLYHGTLHDLYQDVDTENHWHETVLELLKKESMFKMEEKEPLCKNAVPREGIVLRIEGDPMKEAFKLKCIRFLNKEAEDVDKGQVDSETAERY